MKIFNSFKFRFFFVSSLMIAAACSILSVISMHDVKKLLVDVYASQAIPVAEKASSLIDPSVFLRLAASDDKTDPDYEDMCGTFRELKKSLTCRFLYSMAPVEGKNFKYIYDGSDPNNPDEFSELGTVEDITSYGSKPIEAMNEKKTVVADLSYQKEWGWTISIYTPVLDASGKAIGFVGCDFQSEALVHSIFLERVKTAVICALFVLLCIVVLVIISLPFFNSLNSVSKSLKQLSSAEGDLSISIPVSGCSEVRGLAENCNSMIAKLNAMIKEIKDAVASLALAGKELSGKAGAAESAVNDTVQSISEINKKTQQQNELMAKVSGGITKTGDEIKTLGERQEEQTAAVRESSASMEQMTSNVSAIDSNITGITTKYAELMEMTEKGRSLQNQMASQINKIAEHSKGLSAANTTIDEIATRTNLLAMNAAIEAAHAGETGKGFAVVAQEIRTLAENSAKQSAAINTLLTNITEAISGIVLSSGESLKSFNNIGQRISEINGMIQQIHQGMIEQTEGIKQMLEAERIVTQTAESINEASKVMQATSVDSFSGIGTLKSYSDEITVAMKTISVQVEKMKGLSSASAQTMERNREISERVAALVNSFKTN